MFDNTTRPGEDGADTTGVGASPSASAPTTPGEPTPESLADAVAVVRRLADMDWAALPSGDVDRALRIQRQLDGATAALRTRLVAAAAESVVDAAGASDVTNLVKDRLGMSGREARKAATLADGLDGLDATRAALTDGRIGPDAARQIAEAVAEGRLGSAAECEPVLLEHAGRLDPDRLARWIRRRQADAAPASLEDQEAKSLARRRFWSRTRKDGMVEGGFLLPAFTGAMLDTAIGAYATTDPADTPDEARRSFGQRAADAFHDLLGEALSAPAAGRPGRVRPHVLVVATAATLRDGEGTADLADRPISAELARRIGCDAGLSRLLVDANSVPLDLGREVRNWTAGQRRAIVARDGHCRGPACDRPASWCDIHHITWWSAGGRTDLDNGILLCSRHHDLVHHGRWQLALDPASGRATWTSPLGHTVTTAPAGILTTLAATGRIRGPSTGSPADPVLAAETRGHYRPDPLQPAQRGRAGPALRRPRPPRRRATGRALATAGRHVRAP